MQGAEVQPDAYTVVALLATASRNRLVPPAELDALVAHMADAHGILRNTYICAALIQAYRTCALISSEERCALAEVELARMKRGGIAINAEVMNTMISLYWESLKYAESRNAYDEMIQLSIVPSANTYTIMEFLCTEEGRLDEAAKFVQLRMAMQELLGPPEENTGKGKGISGF